MRKSTLMCSAFAATLMTAHLTPAATVGTDNTSAAPYNDSWDYGDNGAVTGNAFDGWRLFANGGSSGFAGFFQDNSTTISNKNSMTDTGAGGDINAAGKSWGLYGGGTGEADAYRDLSGDPLSAGQTFSIALVVNYRNGYKGIDIRDAGQGGATIFNFNTGGDDYTVTTNGTTVSIGNSYSDNTVFNIALTQTDASGGVWTIARSGGVSDLDSGTYLGDVTGLKLYVGGTDGGDPNNLFANNMAVTPEPGTLSIVALAGFAGLRRRRCR